MTITLISPLLDLIGDITTRVKAAEHITARDRVGTFAIPVLTALFLIWKKGPRAALQEWKKTFLQSVLPGLIVTACVVCFDVTKAVRNIRLEADTVLTFDIVCPIPKPQLDVLIHPIVAAQPRTSVTKSFFDPGAFRFRHDLNTAAPNVTCYDSVSKGRIELTTLVVDPDSVEIYVAYPEKLTCSVHK